MEKTIDVKVDNRADKLVTIICDDEVLPIPVVESIVAKGLEDAIKEIGALKLQRLLFGIIAMMCLLLCFLIIGRFM